MVEEQTETRRKRLLYRAMHRGFKEADILLGRFAAEALPEMAGAELDEFEELLALSDHDLYAWIVKGAPPPANLKGPVFERLCEFDPAASARAG